MSYDMKKIDYQNWNFWMDYAARHKAQIKSGEITKEELVFSLYKEHMGKELSRTVSNGTFSEILNYMKIDPYIIKKYPQYIDKYAVRKYVKKKIGDKYLVPIFFRKSKINVSDLERLPDSFVLKTNNGSGTNHIVMNKNEEDLAEICNYMNYLTNLEYGYLHGEYAYNTIKPAIIAEHLILDDNGQIPDDLKCFCFKDKNNVRRKILYIERVIGDERYRIFLNEKWEIIDINCNFERLSIDVKRPDNYKEILSVIDKLSEDFPFVRVDLYTLGNKIYFGELTFTPTAGYMKFDDNVTDQEWGNYIDYHIHKKNILDNLKDKIKRIL